LSVVLFYPHTGTKEITLPPFSVLSIGSMLDKRAFRVEIIDARVERDWKQKIRNSLTDAIFFGISSMTGPQIRGGLEAANIVRKQNPEIPIVWGGFHPTLLPHQTIQHPLVDMIVKGQGEITSIELTECLKGNQRLEDVKGIVYKKNGEIRETEDRPLEDIGNLPPMNYPLIDVEKYVVHDVSPRTIGYISSRGCTHDCGFCAISKFYGRIWSGLKPERVVDEIESLVDHFGVDGIKFLDDNFFVNKERVRQICNMIRYRGLDIKWNASCRCNYIISYDTDLLNVMRKSGCHTIEFGAESGSQKILSIISKDVHVEDTVKSAEICRSYGFVGAYSFMMGFPSETQGDLYETLVLMDRLRKVLPEIEMNMFIYTPYPGTPLYYTAMRNGFMQPQDLEQWSHFSHNRVVVPWIDNKRKRFLEELSFLSWFAFTPSLEKKVKQRHLKLLVRMLRKLAIFRWNNRIFSLPIEWQLIKRLRS